MKKLFCAVVTDPNDEVGLISPIIFHIKCEELSQAEEKVDLLLRDEHGYGESEMEVLDIFIIEVTDLDINEL
jgi:hypothetical protein